MAPYRTVRGNIFLWVSALLVCVLLAFSFVVYDYTSTVVRERFAETLTSLSNSVLANLDAQVGELNRLSLALIYSQVFRDLYAIHVAMPRSPETVRDRIAKLENTEALIEIGDTILGPNQTAPQVNVFDPRGEMIGAGYFSRLIERDARKEPWYPEVVRRNGGRVILPPHRDPLQEATSVVVKDKLYLSLLRSFQDPLLSTQGIVEVKQYCDALFSELDTLAANSAAIFVLDTEGTLLFPYQGSRVKETDLRRLSMPPPGSVAMGFLPGTRELHIYATAVSRETGWTLVFGEPAAGLSSSILQYTTRIALLTLLAILCSLGASYFIARRVTVPIKALHAEIEALELHNLDDVSDGPPGSDLSEIDALKLAFREMRLKLNESVQETVALRAHEKEAELVALQSQLNPHFIHNMLQTIAIMAEEGSREPIQTLILNLSKILRYVSSSEGTTATLGTEVEYAESYLAAMRARFGASLSYVVDIPEAMREIVVPRLILQPFIENCFKYATSKRPPWRVELRGLGEAGRWTIEILDNGPGFAEDTLGSIEESLAVRRAGVGLAPLSISGMGLLNSYERLRLAYGDAAIFEVGNQAGGGARIALGAKRDG